MFRFIPRAAACFLGALLLPLAGHAQDADRAGKADLLAGLYGETLGAAAACPAIPPARINAAAALASQHVKELAGRAADAAGAELAAGIERGRHDVADGEITCAQAESELGNLDHDLSR